MLITGHSSAAIMARGRLRSTAAGSCPQAVSENDPGRKDMLFDIATEELSHLEIIGHIAAMLNKGAKGELAEGADK